MSCAWEFQAAEGEAPAGKSVRVVVEPLDLEPYDDSIEKGDRVHL